MGRSRIPGLRNPLLQILRLYTLINKYGLYCGNPRCEIDNEGREGNSRLLGKSIHANPPTVADVARIPVLDEAAKGKPRIVLSSGTAIL
jgi:hypothetical protein